MPGGAAQWSATDETAAGRAIATPEGIAGHPRGGMTGTGHLPGLQLMCNPEQPQSETTGTGHRRSAEVTDITGHHQAGVTVKDLLHSAAVTDITGHLQGETTGTDHLPNMQLTDTTRHPSMAMAPQRRLAGMVLASLGSGRLPGCTGPPLLPGMEGTAQQAEQLMMRTAPCLECGISHTHCLRPDKPTIHGHGLRICRSRSSGQALSPAAYSTLLIWRQFQTGPHTAVNYSTEVPPYAKMRMRLVLGVECHRCAKP